MVMPTGAKGFTLLEMVMVIVMMSLLYGVSRHYLTSALTHRHFALAQGIAELNYIRDWSHYSECEVKVVLTTQAQYFHREFCHKGPWQQFWPLGQGPLQRAAKFKGPPTQSVQQFYFTPNGLLDAHRAPLSALKVPLENSQLIIEPTGYIHSVVKPI
jgi:prepilin-type N-terminal cleavage/methylation domain-containing protein